MEIDGRREKCVDVERKMSGSGEEMGKWSENGRNGGKCGNR